MRRVVPHEDREVAEAPLPANGFPGDELRDGFGLLDTGDLLNVIDVHSVVPHGAATQSLVDPEGRLESVRVLRDESIGGVEKTLGRATVLDERRSGVVGVALAEAVEVA